MAKASLKGLEDLVEPLAKTYPQVVPTSIQHASEIMSARRTDKSLQDQWFWTADFPLYDVEDGTEVLYFANGKNNLIFKNIEEATGQLIVTGNYRPKSEEAEAVKRAKGTLRVVLSELNLQGNNPVWRYFEIDTANYDTLNPTQRKLAERVYGQGEKFVDNMRMLHPRITKTRIYVLNPDYVRQNAAEGAIARASWLGSFGGDSGFGAGGRGVDGPLGALRGVRLKAPKAQRKKDESVVPQYTPQGIVDYLKTHPVRDDRFAAALLKHANEFYQSRVQKA